MGMNTFSYKKIKENIEKLSQDFSTQLGLYTIPKDINVDGKKEQFQALLNRAKITLENCSSQRKGQLEALIRITNLLIQNVGNDNYKSEELETSINTFLGTFIHRYLRIKSEYPSPLSFFWNVNSRLHSAIEEILGLDYKKLDSFTITKALTIFRATMLLDKTESFKSLESRNESKKNSRPLKKQQYNMFKHYKKDPNFERHLDGLIEDHKLKSFHEFMHFKAIHFLAGVLKEMDANMMVDIKHLENWIEGLKKKYPIFSSLNAEKITSDYKNYFSKLPHFKEKFARFCVCFERLKFDTDYQFDDLDNSLDLAISIDSRSVLYGAYYLLSQINTIRLNYFEANGYKIDEDLIELMKNALFIDSHEDTYILEPVQWLESLEDFEKFVQEHKKLNCEFFGDYDNLLTCISQCKLELQRKVKENINSELLCQPKFSLQC